MIVIPLWAKVCGMIVMLTAGYKGYRVYKSSRSVKLATEPVIGWERHDWTISDDDVGKSSVDPLLLQIRGVERMINISSFRSSRVLCRLQKAKLNIIYYLREAYYSPIMPAIEYLSIAASVFCIIYYYQLLRYVKASWTKMCCNSKWLSRLHSDTTGSKYPAQVVDGREEPGRSDSRTHAVPPAAVSLKPGSLGIQKNGPRSFVDLPTGRNFIPFGPGALLCDDRGADVPELLSGGGGACMTVGANEAGSEADIKLKKEVRFSDEFVNYSYGQREEQLVAKGGSRRRIPSPSKKVPEFGSRILKQTRSSQGFPAKINP